MYQEKTINCCGVDYIVSNDGRVFSTKNVGRGKYHKELLQRKNIDGYMVVTVGTNNHRTHMRVHRMVALDFIPNPNNLPEVNHKNYDRTDNHVDNLEWISHSENVVHSAKIGKYVHTGKDNPNYGNRMLSKKYKNDPILAKEKQGRPGAQNGRARKIKIIDLISGFEYTFDYIGAAASHIIQQFFHDLKPSTVANALSKCAEATGCYKDRYLVSFIPNKCANTVPN